MDLESLIGNDDLLEVARRAVEDALIDMRDSRIFQPMRRNGLVICEKDGTPSNIIRLGFEQAMSIGVKAIVEYIKENGCIYEK